MIRRIYSDVLGLPPSPEERAAAKKMTWAELVDSLLKRPQYGERIYLNRLVLSPRFRHVIF